MTTLTAAGGPGETVGDEPAGQDARLTAVSTPDGTLGSAPRLVWVGGVICCAWAVAVTASMPAPAKTVEMTMSLRMECAFLERIVGRPGASAEAAVDVVGGPRVARIVE